MRCCQVSWDRDDSGLISASCDDNAMETLAMRGEVITLRSTLYS